MTIQQPATDRTLRGVAILIGVPLEFGDFISRVEASDWLAKYNPADLEPDVRLAALHDNWEQEYKPDVADPINELQQSAASIGAEIKPRATLSDLCEYSRTHDVVIIFAHWKGAEVEAEDVLQRTEISQFVDRLAHERPEIARWLLPRFDVLAKRSRGDLRVGFLKRLLDTSKASKQFASVQELLSAAVSLPRLPDETDSDTTFILETEVTRQAHRRETLDKLLQGLLRPGNRLELYDGLHSKEAVQEAIPSSFAGTLDLTTCTSTFLGDYLGAMANHRVRVIQYPTVQQFAWCAECVQLALALYVREGMSYQHARLEAKTLLKTAVLQTTTSNK